MDRTRNSGFGKDTKTKQNKNKKQTKKSQIFWQNAINNKRSKLKLQLDGIEIEGLLNTGAGIT